MATEANITADDDFFIGEDKTLKFHVVDDDGVPVNIAAWTLSWMLKIRRDDPDDDALVTKTTASGVTITGSYSATLASNTQRAEVAIADTDTDVLADRLYVGELKRMDAGLEAVLSYGTARLKRGVHRS